MDLGEASLPDDLQCPITSALFRDPVVNKVGNTYERDALEKVWMRSGGAYRDPLTNVDVLDPSLVPNWDMRRRVQVFLDNHPDYIPDSWPDRSVPPVPSLVSAQALRSDASAGRWGFHGWWVGEEGSNTAIASFAVMITSLFVSLAAVLMESSQVACNYSRVKSNDESKSCSPWRWRSGVAGLLVLVGVAAISVHMLSEKLRWYRRRTQVLIITTFCGCIGVALLALGLLALLLPVLASNISILAGVTCYAAYACFDELDYGGSLVSFMSTSCIAFIQLGVADWLFPGVASSYRVLGGLFILELIALLRQYLGQRRLNVVVWLGNAVGVALVVLGATPLESVLLRACNLLW